MSLTRRRRALSGFAGQCPHQKGRRLPGIELRRQQVEDLLGAVEVIVEVELLTT
jgi:hypothetical protein